MLEGETIFLAAQKEVDLDEPTEEEIHHIGTVAKVNQMMKLPNGTMRVLVEGLYRAEIIRFLEDDKQFMVEIEERPDEHGTKNEEEALMRALLEQFEQYIKVSKKIGQETFATLTDITEPGRMADMITSHLSLRLDDKIS